MLFFLVRCVPEYMLCLQNGKFDAADRMFDSVKDAWTSVRAASTDLKELIPEFYDGDGEFLVNGRNVPLGVTQAGERLGDVKLPPWARNPADFVKQCRAALESDYVSARLHHWIDLVFGCKQRSIDDDNVFHPLTYEGTVDLDKVAEERERSALELQIDEFGQTPRKLFDAPHVRRDGELLETPPPPASESDDDDETVLVDAPPPTPPKAAAARGRAARPTLSVDYDDAPAASAPPPPPPPAAAAPAAAPAKPPNLQPRVLEVARAPPPAPAPLRPRPRQAPAPALAKAPPPSSFPRAASDRPRFAAPSEVASLHRKKTSRPHRDVTTDVAYARGVVATSCRDGGLKLSSLGSDDGLTTTRSFAASPLALSCVALDDDATLAVAGGWDNHVVAYRADTACLAARFEAHDASISGLALRGGAPPRGDRTTVRGVPAELRNSRRFGRFLDESMALVEF